MSEKIDAYHGQGGSYVADAKTGDRKLIERTQLEPLPPPTQSNETTKPA